jgi:hypothetical protein
MPYALSVKACKLKGVYTFACCRHIKPFNGLLFLWCYYMLYTSAFQGCFWQEATAGQGELSLALAVP